MANAFFPGSASANYFYGIYGIYGRQLSGHAAPVDRIQGLVHRSRHLRLQVRLLHVLRPAGQLDAHLDERRGRQLSRHDRQLAARLQLGGFLRLQLHAFAFHRQCVGRRRLRRPGWRGDPKHIQSRANSAARPISTSAIRRTSTWCTNCRSARASRSGAALRDGRTRSSEAGRFRASCASQADCPASFRAITTWDTNYWQSTLAIPTAAFKTQTGYDNNGNPSLFANTNAGK